VEYTAARKTFSVNHWRRQIRILAAAMALVAVLFLLLVPQAGSGHSAWLAILPIFFVGLLFPLGAPRRVFAQSSGRIPAAPFRRSAFQRPPPAWLS
jgi:hypothetical protein